VQSVDKAIRFVDYLHILASLRTNIVRSVDKNIRVKLLKKRIIEFYEIPLL
jgi:hypothetical protein